MYTVQQPHHTVDLSPRTVRNVHVSGTEFPLENCAPIFLDKNSRDRLGRRWEIRLMPKHAQFARFGWEYGSLARLSPRALRTARATGRPAVLTPRAPLRPEPSRRTLRANLGYRWAYLSSASRLFKLSPEKPSRKLRAGVAKTTFVSNAQPDTP